MGKLKIIVLYDRVLVDEEEPAAASDKSPVTRTLDKKEVEEEVAEALTKLGHEPQLHELDGTPKSLLALAAAGMRSGLQPDRVVCRRRHRRLQDRRFPRADRQEVHRIGHARPDAGAGQGHREEDLRVSRHPHAGLCQVVRGRLDFSHDLQFPVIVKPAREDGSIGIEFSAVVSSIRELMERMDWLHANFDSPVLIEEYIDGREMYVGVLGNDKPEALPVIELDLSKLPGRHAADCRGRSEVGQGHRRLPRHEIGRAYRPARRNGTRFSRRRLRRIRRWSCATTAASTCGCRRTGACTVIEVNPNPWLSSRAELAMAARKAGRTYTQLIEEIVELAMARA